MAKPQQANVICLTIDRLHAGYLGAYGNTWIQTPALDRLAAESFLLDRAVTDSPRLDVVYRSLWQGLHAMVPAKRAAGHGSMIERFSKAPWQTALLTDELSVAEHPLAAAFTEREVLKPAADKRNVAASIEDTQAAEFFAAASAQIQQLKPPFFLWLHTGTLDRVWDAPLEFRELYRDEDDPAAEDWANVPDRLLPDRFDPDELLSITHAYAGQVTLIDRLVGSLLESMDEGKLKNSLVVVFSPRGFPLGEHRRVGACDDALYSELTHIPWMMRFPDGLGRADRTLALAQPADLAATISDWAGLPISSQPSAGHGQSLLPLVQGNKSPSFDRACIVAPPDQKVIVTPAWSLRIANQAQNRTELFGKPDDWFEVNEVSNRCGTMVEQLETALVEFETACETGTPAVLAELPVELIHGSE